MKKLSKPLFNKIALFTILILLTANYIIWKETNAYIKDEFKNELHLKAKAALKILNYSAFSNHDFQLMKSTVDEITEMTNVRTSLIDKNGILLGDSEFPVSEVKNLGNYLNKPEIVAALRDNVGFKMRLSSTLHKYFLYYCEPIVESNKILGFIRVAIYPEVYNEKISFIKKIILEVNVIILILLVLMYSAIKRSTEKTLNRFYHRLKAQKDNASFNALESNGILEYDNISDLINQIFEIFNSEKLLLLNEKNYLNKVINSLSEGIAAFNSNGVLNFYNNKFCEILEIDIDKSTDEHAYNIIGFPPMLNDLKKFLNKMKPQYRKIKYYNNKFLEYKINKFKINKNDIGFIIIVEDITTISNLETVRSDFIANVSHEFKTPLTSIRGYAETLLSGTVKDENTENRFLQKIFRQTVYLENLVTDLLKLNKIEKKEIDDISEINVCPIIDEIASEFESLTEKKNIKFIYKNEVGRKCVVNANSNLITNIITNFVANSIQYSKPHGSIWLSILLTNNSTLRIEVKDDGIGVPAKDKLRIFERFYRVDKAKEVYAEGSGLGLSIVKNVVELLDGEFGFESTENEGSLFWVELKTIG